MSYDYLIVGAGFAGAVMAERIARESGKKVLIIDKRGHIGGNCYDYTDDNGILIHRYGPHAFHTNLKKVFDYLNRFTEFTPYEHRVLADIEGQKVPVPFNFKSIDLIYGKDKGAVLKDSLLKYFPMESKIPILKLREIAGDDLKELAEYIYSKIFYGYTLKQWGLKPEELDFSVSSRVPVHISNDDRYFQDRYQAIPSEGYTKLFENRLNHKNIDLELNLDFKQAKEQIKFNKLIFTGPIDSYFDYYFGDLPYRSLNFDFVSLDQKNFQATAQVNYPNEHDYTRITEFKHFLNQRSSKTTIAYEYPMAYKEGENDPYYPIQEMKNDLIYQKYRNEADKLSRDVLFTGRLAEYKYYNMDQIIAVAIKLFDQYIK